MTARTDGTWLVWMWHYGSLSVYPHPTLEAAVEDARDTSNHGAGSFHYIETADGSKVDQETVNQIWERLSAEEEADLDSGPKYKYVVELTPLDDPEDWTTVDWFTNKREAERSERRYRARLGEKRVRMKEIERG